MDDGGLTLESLRCFDALATTLHFRSAAKRVFLSPAAFSDRIKRLERHLNTQLFARSTRSVSLSPQGEKIWPSVRSVLAGSQSIEQSVLTVGSQLPFQLTIGTRYELGLSWLCPSLSALEQANPSRSIHLYNGDSPDLLLRLERGDIDAAVSSMRLISARLTYVALHAEEYVLVSRRNCLQTKDEASALTLIDVSPDIPLFRYFLDAQRNAVPWEFRKHEYLGGIGNIRWRLLHSKQSLAVLPGYFVKADIAAGKLVRLLPKAKMQSDSFRLIWKKGHPRHRELRELAKELQRIPLK
jgi:LysR family transcriptional regulator, glycine cleavage system transcriptional activator